MVVAEERGSSLQGVESGLRVFAVSDLHVDHAQNLSWVRQLPAHVGSPSVLILAGEARAYRGNARFAVAEVRPRFVRTLPLSD